MTAPRFTRDVDASQYRESGPPDSSTPRIITGLFSRRFRESVRGPDEHGGAAPIRRPVAVDGMNVYKVDEEEQKGDNDSTRRAASEVLNEEKKTLVAHDLFGFPRICADFSLPSCP
uniref:RNase NYN domain-containing protein n=1 Tax=Steinernema glaseri TaxID=37863 RepID=A0A1I7YDY1_9BILA